MAISDHDRKVLWGRAANRCAICRKELVRDETGTDREAIVGEECHIISAAPTGPRAADGSVDVVDFDAYANLILLCRNDHRHVDEQPGRFTTESLRELKQDHEAWVSTTLDVKTPPRIRVTGMPEAVRLSEMRTGDELFDLFVPCVASRFLNVTPESEEEAELFGDFFQDLHDLGDIWEDIGVRAQMHERFAMTRRLSELSEKGFVVLAGTWTGCLEGGHGPPEPWREAVVRIVPRKGGQRA